MRVTPDSHPIRYFVWLYSPAPQRVLLEALFGIEREIAESLRPGLDHHVAHSRLQWWREEFERTVEGRAVHPLTREVVAAFNGAPPAQLTGLSGFVDITVWDLAGATFETRRELAAYCERWAAAMVEPLVAHAMTRPDAGSTGQNGARPVAAVRDGSSANDTSVAHVAPGASANWRALGTALRELEMLTDLAREAHSGRLRIPMDEMEASGADPAALAKPPWPEAMGKLLRDRHETLRGDVARNLGNLNSQQQLSLRGLLVWAELAWRSSWRAQRALPDRLRAGRFDAIADGWFAWRVARRATIGRYRLD